MWDAFQGEYLPESPAIVLESQELRSDREGRTTITAQLVVDGEHRTVTGDGNGPIDAFVRGVRRELGLDLDVVDYAEHALGAGADATAVAYVEALGADGQSRWGVGTDPNIITASLRAVVSAILRERRA
jgi:2-isopropylmalate synthase